MRNRPPLFFLSLMLAGCFGPGEYIYLNSRGDDADASVDGGLQGEFVSIRVHPEGAGVALTESIYDFPVLLRLSETDFDFESTDPSGSSIRFADEGGEPLAHEIELWDVEHRQAAVWILLHELKAASAEQTIRMYLDAPNAPTGSVFANPSEFSAVLHLGETGNNLNGGYKDSSDNGRDGTGVNMTASSCVPGVSGFGQHLDSNAYVEIIGLAGEPTSVTLSIWFSPGAAEGDLVSLGDSVILRLEAASGNLLGMVYSGDNWQIVRTPVQTGSNWHYAALVVDTDAGRQTLYLDGKSVRNVSFSGHVDYTVGYDKTTIGVHAQTNQSFFTGSIDEMEISPAARSAEWIKLCYENQRPEGQSLLEIVP